MEAGLIGLGRMGTGIAKSLLRAGHRLTVFNRTRARAEALRADGANISGSVAEACQSGVVLTMVADDAALEVLVFGKDGILASLPAGGLHVALSTISVTLSDRFITALARGHQDRDWSVIGRVAAEDAGLPSLRN
jgi:3-hydroxyisobutyrate dehydrogenase-like beta-hydroxyacid dehydrogenase